MKKKISNYLLGLLTLCVISCANTQTITNTQQQDPHSVTINEINFKYIDFKRDSNNLKFNILITSKTKDLIILLKESNFPIIIDSNGNEYKCSMVSIGQKQKQFDSWWGNSIQTELFKDIALKMEVTFKNIPENVGTINLLQFKLLHLLDGKGHFDNQIKEIAVKIREIKI